MGLIMQFLIPTRVEDISVEAQHQLYDISQVILNDLAKSYLVQNKIKYSDKTTIKFKPFSFLKKFSLSKRFSLFQLPPSYFLQLLNHQSKLIHQRPRRVSFSSQFKITQENKGGFSALVKDIESGADLNKYLSYGIYKAQQSDGMLDHFGCKHFHLGIQSKGKIKRTQEIAIAFINDDEVFFILSKPHGKGFSLVWGESDIVEILHQERVDLISHAEIKTLKDISATPLMSREYIQSRRLKLNQPIVLQKTMYAPINGGNSAIGLGFQLSLVQINVEKYIFRKLCQLYVSYNDMFKKDFLNQSHDNMFSLVECEDGIINLKIKLDGNEGTCGLQEPLSFRLSPMFSWEDPNEKAPR